MATQVRVADVQALQGHGGDHKSTEFQGSYTNLEKVRRGANTRYQIARLKRDHPEIVAELEAGKYRSVRAAAKAAGLVHEPTPLDMLHRYWRKVPPEDRLSFLCEMLTPNERRAIQCGFVDVLPR